MFFKRIAVFFLLLFLSLQVFSASKKSPVTVPTKVKTKIENTAEARTSWYICELKNKTKAGNVVIGPVESRELILLIWIANSIQPDKTLCIAKNKTYITKNPEKFFNEEYLRVKKDISEYGLADTYEKYFFTNFLKQADTLTIQVDKDTEKEESQSESNLSESEKESPKEEEEITPEEKESEETETKPENKKEEKQAEAKAAPEEVKSEKRETKTPVAEKTEKEESKAKAPESKAEEAQPKAEPVQTKVAAVETKPAPVETEPAESQPEPATVETKTSTIVVKPAEAEKKPEAPLSQPAQIYSYTSTESAATNTGSNTQKKGRFSEPDEYEISGLESPYKEKESPVTQPPVSQPSVSQPPVTQPLISEPVINQPQLSETVIEAPLPQEPEKTEEALPLIEETKPQEEEMVNIAEEAPSEEVPVAEAPAEETPVEEVPVEKAPAPSEENEQGPSFELPVNSTAVVNRYQKENLLDYAPKKTPSLPKDEEEAEFKPVANPNQADSKGFTLLMKAAKNGNDFDIKNLIASGADLDLIDKDGWTALMYAVRYQENYSIVEALINAGARVKTKNKFEVSSLTLAASYNNNPQILKLLLESYNPSEKEILQAFTIMLSDNSNSDYSKISKIDAFVQKGININSFYNGKTPLMYAAQFSTSTIVIKQLLDYGAATTIRTVDGKTAFDFAKQNSSLSHDETYWALNKK